MAVLYVTEYASLGQVLGIGQMPQEPALVEQAIAITGSSTTTAAFNAKTRFVRLHTDAICGVTLGTAPTATTPSTGLGSQRLAANQTQFHGVPEGGAYKAAVISST